MAKKVLVVDDAPSIIELMSFWLTEAGYEIVVAQDGIEGFELAKSESPDIIILDIMLPKIDGYNVCRLLKSDDQYKDIPVIILTAREQEDDEDVQSEVGASSYIEKPVEKDQLLKSISDLLGE